MRIVYKISSHLFYSKYFAWDVDIRISRVGYTGVTGH